jgi:hypothetical protein
MVVLSGVDLNTRLVSFECNTISNSRSEHHLRALHEIVHAILKLWHKCLFVDEIEVNSLISNDLDSNITSYEVDLTSSFG